MLSNDLPKDLMEEIMVRLPIKSLLRFKCVAKSWYALVTDHYFITKHFERSNSTGKNHRLRLVYKPFCHNDLPPSVSLIPNKDQPYEIQNLECPFNENNLKEIFVYGQCNGIFCLRGDYEDDYSLILWNPTTKEVKTIPLSQWQPERMYWESYGFGFDSITKDYKIVQSTKGKPVYQLAQIYNLSTNSWRKLDVDVSIFHRCHSTMGHYLNGAYYWLTTSCYNLTDHHILSFSFSKEAFRIIQRPPGITSSPMQNNILAIVNESLAWVVIQVSSEVCLEIWVMNEYGLESSWTKKHEIRPFPYSFSWYTLQFWGDNDIIVFDDSNRQLISYNLQNQRTERLKDYFRTMMDYVESLFPLEAGKGNHKKM